MIDPIRPIGPAPQVDSIDLSPLAKEAAASFGKMFAEAVDRVEQFRADSQEKSDRLLRGEDQELHEVVLAGQRAELEFQYFLQMRNKVVQAYQEIMRMQM